MAKITHQDMRGGQAAPASTHNTQNFVVDDYESENSQKQSIEQRLAAFESPAVQNENVIPEKQEVKNTPMESKKKLEKIIFMGRHTKTIEFAGHKFDMSTITHKENNEIMSRLMKIGEVADIFTIRTLTLANAIKSIDGCSLLDIEIDGDFANALDHNIAIVDNMQVSLVERLFKVYEEMVKESDNVVYGEAIKN